MKGSSTVEVCVLDPSNRTLASYMKWTFGHGKLLIKKDAARRSKFGFKNDTHTLGRYKYQVQARQSIRTRDGNQMVIQCIVGVNTEGAEQCFSDLHKLAATPRSQGMCSSRLTIAVKIHQKKQKIIAKYERAPGVHEPRGVSGPISGRWRPCQTLMRPLQL
eukprot:jgi/Ulvmu1/7355/UM036_0015.1